MRGRPRSVLIRTLYLLAATAFTSLPLPTVGELRAFWDLTIFVEASFEVTLVRAQQRDHALFGTVAEVRKRYEQRYIPGQRLYLEECRPKERATVVVENNDPRHPVLWESQGEVSHNDL
jgi:hypothetical protein